MRVRDIMSSRPIVVGERASDVKRLMEVGHVNHVPVVEGGRLVGIWIATEGGTLLMLGPDQVYETRPGVDATEALEALVEGAEAVLVWDSGVPAGVLTRTDLLSVVRTRGAPRHRPAPSAPGVVRIAGPAASGKTTLLMRTLGLLARIDVAIIQGNAQAPGEVAALAGRPRPRRARRPQARRAPAGGGQARRRAADPGGGPRRSRTTRWATSARTCASRSCRRRSWTRSRAERLEGVEALVATRADECRGDGRRGRAARPAQELSRTPHVRRRRRPRRPRARRVVAVAREPGLPAARLTAAGRASARDRIEAPVAARAARARARHRAAGRPGRRRRSRAGGLGRGRRRGVGALRRRGPRRPDLVGRPRPRRQARGGGPHRLAGDRGGARARRVPRGGDHRPDARGRERSGGGGRPPGAPRAVGAAGAGPRLRRAPPRRHHRARAGGRDRARATSSWCGAARSCRSTATSRTPRPCSTRRRSPASPSP